ncbi:diaminopimelate epimerase [Spirochaetia bacterium]|nr:diaminopimelate epimerase [Spirochaetia bacterium]
MEIVIADPAKNITIFVLDPIAGGPERTETAKALLADPSLKAEQVGFVLPPALSGPGDGRAYWRLEMMGGEFCGNAARSFGLFVARETGLKGRHTVMIEISGMKEPLPVNVDCLRRVHTPPLWGVIKGMDPETDTLPKQPYPIRSAAGLVDTEAGRAEVEIPRPLAQGSLSFEGHTLPVFVFDGITHVLAPGLKPDRDTFFAIKEGVRHHFDAGRPVAAERSPDALGVMFYDIQKQFMQPAVYVVATDSLVFESSCGSGSAALALWKTADIRDEEGRCDVAPVIWRAAQPGGIIEVKVSKHNGEISSIAIGGPVGLSGRMRV